MYFRFGIGIMVRAECDGDVMHIVSEFGKRAKGVVKVMLMSEWCVCCLRVIMVDVRMTEYWVIVWNRWMGHPPFGLL